MYTHEITQSVWYMTQNLLTTSFSFSCFQLLRYICVVFIRNNIRNKLLLFCCRSSWTGRVYKNIFNQGSWHENKWWSSQMSLISRKKLLQLLLSIFREHIITGKNVLWEVIFQFREIAGLEFYLKVQLGRSTTQSIVWKSPNGLNFACFHFLNNFLIVFISELS